MVSVDDKTALLIYRVGPVFCCSPTRNVETITIPTTLTHPPGTDAAHPGIFKHGGHIVSVSDLRYLFGVEQSEWRQPGRMIITELKDGHVGFWVDEIIDVIQFPEKGWGNLPPHLPRGIFGRTLLLKEYIHLYAEFEKLNTLNTAGYLKQYIATLIEQQVVKRTGATNNKIPTSTSKITGQAGKQPSDKNENITIKPQTTKEVTTSKTESLKTKTLIQEKPSSAPGDKRINIGEPVTHSTTQITTKDIVEQKEISTPEIKKPHGTIHTTSFAQTPAKPQAAEKHNEPINIDTDKLSAVPNKHTDTGIANSKIIKASQTATNTNKSPAPPGTVENNSSGVGFLLLLIFLFAGTGYGVYHFLIDTPTKSRTSITYQQPVVTDIEPATSSITPYEKPPQQEEVADTVIEKPEQTATIDTENVHPDTEPSPEPETATLSPVNIEETKTDNGYRASIEKSEDGITIILHQPEKAQHPEQDDQKATDTIEETVHEDEAETASRAEANQSQPDTVAKTSLEAKPITKAQPDKEEAPPQPRKVEIIHIVVKGDTLWHIARRYVENPFLYPELARLSNIKNPHLIYPGNKVRIIKYLN